MLIELQVCQYDESKSVDDVMNTYASLKPLSAYIGIEVDMSTHYRDLSPKMIFDLAGLDCVRRMLLNDLEKFYNSLMFLFLGKTAQRLTHV